MRLTCKNQQVHISLKSLFYFNKIYLSPSKSYKYTDILCNGYAASKCQSMNLSQSHYLFITAFTGLFCQHTV